MLKKILIVLSLLLLVSCIKDKKETTVIDEYIAPVKDVFLFDELDGNLKQRIKKANGNKDYLNYQFKMLGRGVYEKDLTDIKGNTINLKDYDNFILEVLSTACSHCRDSIRDNVDNLLNLDTTLIQYFNIGDRTDIENLYEDINKDIPENIIIIGRDKNFEDYLKNEICIDRYPTLISYKDGELTFSSIGDMNLETSNSFYEISFVDPIARSELIDEDGNDLLTLDRSIDDVKNDLSRANQNKINELDNDEYTKEATYKLIGKEVDFVNMNNDRNNPYISEIEDFSKYQDSELVLLFTYLKDETDTDKVKYVNELIESNDSVEYIVVLIEGMDTSSVSYSKMNLKFKSPVVSVLGYIPADFFTIGIANYPTALFIRSGIFTGAYSNIESVDMFNEAVDTFLGEGSIALLKNN